MSAADWTKIEWVILDMDGTVLDLAYDNYFWRELVPQRYADKNALTLEQARAILTPKFAAIAHTLPWYCTDYWSETTGLNLAALKGESRERIRVLPGAVDFLRAVRASGKKLWLATNAHRDSWQLKLAHTGLRELFDVVICSHDYGAPKEDARFWAAMQQQHPYDKSRALFVDDSPPVLRAAQAHQLGWVIAIRHPDTTAPAREVSEFAAVDALADLLPIV